MNDESINWGENWKIYHLFAKSDSISHKEAWTQFAQNENKCFRQLEYYYYPRGRVVIRNNKATIFLNRHIATDEVVSAINKIFGLTAPKIHAEGSRHYKCYIDKN